MFIFPNSLFLVLLPKFQTMMTTLISRSSHKAALEVRGGEAAEWPRCAYSWPPTHTLPHALVFSQRIIHYFVKHSFLATERV